MSEKQTTEQAVLEVLGAKPEASTTEVAEAAGIGRSTAAKQLAAFERAGKVARHPGGREGSRRLPDRWALAGETGAAKQEGKGPSERLRPGQLDGLVLAFMADNRDDGPHTASAIGKGIGRSSGAVANCLKRLAAAGQVHEEDGRPRRYAIGDASRG